MKLKYKMERNQVCEVRQMWTLAFRIEVSVKYKECYPKTM
jgi:hypothetical protein